MCQAVSEQYNDPTFTLMVLPSSGSSCLRWEAFMAMRWNVLAPLSWSQKSSSLGIARGLLTIW